MQNFDIIVIGGGAAGYFGAIAAKEKNPKANVLLLEGTRRPLTKVRISGGGRCNVTHHCFEPRDLVKNYPRGSKELLQAFSRFQPKDTIAWFKKNGVELHVEADGRMFPVTNSSETIIQCLTEQAKTHGVVIRLGAPVKSISRVATGFELQLSGNETLATRCLLIATGSFEGGYAFAKSVGHTVTPLVPSLFTFVVDDGRLKDMAGVSFSPALATLKANDKVFSQRGPVLITHWGFSGPAILKLSAFAARELFDSKYQAEIVLNLFPDLNVEQMKQMFDSYKKQHPTRSVAAHCPLPLVNRYWENLLLVLGVEKSLKYAELRKETLNQIVQELSAAKFTVNGKGEFKEEFVTCGGVSLREVSFQTFESKVTPNLFFAGEVLDVDGITGGFNFQNAWTSGYLAGQAMAERCS